MANFQPDSTRNLHRLLSLFFLLFVSTGIAHGHSFPRKLSLPGLGDLIGYYSNHSEVISFKGIPYAKPPTGKLRFHKPEHITWNGTLDTKNNTPVCMQPHHHSSEEHPPQSEDCLHLNVFVPGDKIDPKAKNKVMVWIHGGRFQSGSAYTHDVRYLSKFGKVIVVTINYRLNIFGFLSNGHSIMPGNAGLHDQVMALEWVKMNIGSFGGDPKDVTVFGETAGAVSIYILLASPAITEGLFTRAIVQSGMIHPLADPKEDFKKVAKLTSCPHIVDKNHTHSAMKQIHCLQNKTSEELLAVVTDHHAPVLGPVIDKIFLNKTILKQLGEKKRSIPCLIGLNNHELVLNAKNAIKDKRDLMERISSLGHPPYSSTVTGWIVDWFKSKNHDETYMKAYNSKFLNSIQHVTKYIGPPSTTFMYYFTHHPSFTKPNDYHGAKSNDELPFVFGEVFKKSINATEAEEALSKTMIEYYSTFAYNGKPNNSNWTSVSDGAYIELNGDRKLGSVKRNLGEANKDFWNVVIPKMVKIYSDPFEHHPSNGGSALRMPVKAVQNLLLPLTIVMVIIGVFIGL